MRSTKLTAVGLLMTAALAAGPLMLGSTAAATAAAPTEAGIVLMGDEDGGTWTGGAARDMESGDWRATVSNGEVTILVGHYATEKEARKAGKKKAKEMNEGVVAGPGCDDPFVLC
jgi:hypothetical protein